MGGVGIENGEDPHRVRGRSGVRAEYEELVPARLLQRVHGEEHVLRQRRERDDILPISSQCDRTGILQYSVDVAVTAGRLVASTRGRVRIWQRRALVLDFLLMHLLVLIVTLVRDIRDPATEPGVDRLAREGFDGLANDQALGGHKPCAGAAVGGDAADPAHGDREGEERDPTWHAGQGGWPSKTSDATMGGTEATLVPLMLRIATAKTGSQGCRGLRRSGDTAAPQRADCLLVLFSRVLHGRAGPVAVGAKDTAITRERAQHESARRALEHV